jgi:bifunctional non-homologous end joining protein LigD
MGLLSPPRFIPPQLTKVADTAPDGDGWVHEIKLDGYRLAARIEGKRTTLLTRTGLDWTAKYEAIAASLAKLNVGAAYIDGEICALRPDGTTSYAELQPATDHKTKASLVYFAFDLLFIDGEDLTVLPLIESRERLQSLLRRAPKNILYLDHAIGNGKALYAAMCKHDVEGIVSKRIDAQYKPGDRGLWRKIKCINEYLGALLLGYYTPDGKLICTSPAGTGMDEAELKRLYDKLKPIEVGKMTVTEPPPRSNRFGAPLKLSMSTG